MTIIAPGVAAASRTIAGLAFFAAVLSPVAVWAQDAGALAKRVQQLEEQLVDMQVVVGTLESTKATGGAAAVGPAYAPPPAGGGYGANYGGASDSARLDGIETQIQALTVQMEQLSREVRTLSSQRGSLSPPSGSAYAAAPQSNDAVGSYDGFGTTTVTPGREDGIGGLLSGDGINQSGGASAKQMYETAYGYMLQQDYGAAEIAFRDFLSRYPQDPLAGNAQFWLGETYYLRGEYKTAATAFLEGYEKHRQNAKAPNSLLKLAMSLDRMGQKDAACSSYSELSAQYPNAPADIRRQASTERRRSGC